MWSGNDIEILCLLKVRSLHTYLHNALTGISASGGVARHQPHGYLLLQFLLLLLLQQLLPAVLESQSL